MPNDNTHIWIGAPRQTELLPHQKMAAVADKHYYHIKWNPKAGDYYTTERPDLELYRIVKIENGKVYTEYCTDPRNLSEWDEAGFTTQGFGPQRTHVADYIFGLTDPYVISRTPAEPKAGDWEDDVERYDRDLLRDPDGEFIKYSDLSWIIDRALSSAAPRITEQDIADAMLRADFADKPDSEGNMEHFTRFVSASTRRAMAEYLSGRVPPAPLSGITEGETKLGGHIANLRALMEQRKDYEALAIIRDIVSVMDTGNTVHENRSSPASLSGITGDSDKSDLPIANSVQLSEEMVERAYEIACNLFQGSPSREEAEAYEWGATEVRNTLFALLRQQGAERSEHPQGPQRSEDQQGAEGKWISVDECDWDDYERVDYAIALDPKHGSTGEWHIKPALPLDHVRRYAMQSTDMKYIVRKVRPENLPPPPFTPTSHQVTSEATQTEE